MGQRDSMPILSAVSLPAAPAPRPSAACAPGAAPAIAARTAADPARAAVATARPQTLTPAPAASVCASCQESADSALAPDAAMHARRTTRRHSSGTKPPPPAMPRRRPCSGQCRAAGPSAASSTARNRSAASTADFRLSRRLLQHATPASRNTVSCGSCSGSTSSSSSAKKLSTAMRTWSTGRSQRRAQNLQLIEPHQLLPGLLGKPGPRHRHRLQRPAESLAALQRRLGHALHPPVIAREKAHDQVGLMQRPGAQNHRF